MVVNLKRVNAEDSYVEDKNGMFYTWDSYCDKCGKPMMASGTFVSTNLPAAHPKMICRWCGHIES